MMLYVPVSFGELIDKIIILEIKTERVEDPAKLANIGLELNELRKIRDKAISSIPAEMQTVIDELRVVLDKGWDIENGKRACERDKDFGPKFLELARNVYLNNDARSRLKRQLNEMFGSVIIEEKSYVAY